MNDTAAMWTTAAIAVSAVLFCWVAIDIGSSAFGRYRQMFTERAHFSLRELFLFVEPQRLFVLNLTLLACAGAASWVVTGSAMASAAAMGLLALVPRLLLKWLRARRLAALEQQLPDALLILAGGMKAGVSLAQSIQQLVAESRPPLSQEFDLLLREQRLGVSIDEALDSLNRRVPLQSVTLAVSAMRIANETGGELAETLERASQTLRNKLAMEGKIRALTSQGKLQAWVVGALPLFLILVLTRMEPEAMNMLYTTQLGWATLVLIGILEVFGVILIRKIVDIDV